MTRLVDLDADLAQLAHLVALQRARDLHQAERQDEPVDQVGAAAETRCRSAMFTSARLDSSALNPNAKS
jgi:hypothetical protein